MPSLDLRNHIVQSPCWQVAQEISPETGFVPRTFRQGCVVRATLDLVASFPIRTQSVGQVEMEVGDLQNFCSRASLLGILSAVFPPLTRTACCAREKKNTSGAFGISTSGFPAGTSIVQELTSSRLPQSPPRLIPQNLAPSKSLLRTIYSISGFKKRAIIHLVMNEITMYVVTS